MVGAAIAGAAIVGAVASSSAASAQAGAIGQASEAQNAATMASIAEQRRQYDQTREDFAPYREIGATALGEYGALFGVGRNGLIPVNASDVPGQTMGPSSTEQYQTGMEQSYTNNAGQTFTGAEAKRAYDEDLKYYGYDQANARGGLSFTPSYDSRTVPGAMQDNAGTTSQSMEEARNRFKETPGYQFRMEEGVRAMDRSAAAQGKLRSGGYGRALTEFGQGIGAAEFDNYANRLAGIAGMGQGATQSTATLNQSSSNNMANTMMAGGQAQANNLINAGTARASGYTGMANSLNSGVQNYAFQKALNRPYDYSGYSTNMDYSGYPTNMGDTGAFY